ncbi:FAD binding domain-containing protein [Phlebopus sp. FC_14]|nr:FAD binding domain-containing protein [Phlebopus sp. FC_14]
MAVESRVDVLIIGAGPAGLMCGNALATAGVDVRIIDQRPVKVSAGQADGIQPRTIEVLQSYGLAERLIREGNQMHMCAFYNPNRHGGIERTYRASDVNAPTARFPFEVTLHQGAIEALFLDSMAQHGIKVERPVVPTAIKVSEDIQELQDYSSYPVEVTLERLDATADAVKTEIVRAKFVVGADGAHSWVRKALGITMDGEQTDYIWGVVDSVPDTNFPDVRNKTVVHSMNGSCMVIPREGDKVRLYIQLSDRDVVDPLTCRVDKKRMSPEKLFEVAKTILHPFELHTPPEFDWWTLYIVGQRVASRYSVKERVFIAGDACHTHSPKAGQGMNASMNDTHNLGTVENYAGSQRMGQPIASEDGNRIRSTSSMVILNKLPAPSEFAALVSGKPVTIDNQDGVSHEQLLRAFQTFGGFTSGIGVHYAPSAIVDVKHQKCAQNLIIGQRMLPQIFVRAADARPLDIQDVLPADVRFKVLIFAGHVTETQVTHLNLLAEQLDKPSSFLRKYPAHGNFSSIFDIVTIIAGKKEDVDYNIVPMLLRLHWSKVLLDDTDVTRRQGGNAYERFGIDPSIMTLVVVRPDGYVGMVAPSTALDDVDEYFAAFLIPRGL